MTQTQVSIRVLLRTRPLQLSRRLILLTRVPQILVALPAVMVGVGVGVVMVMVMEGLGVVPNSAH